MNACEEQVTHSLHAKSASHQNEHVGEGSAHEWDKLHCSLNEEGNRKGGGDRELTPWLFPAPDSGYHVTKWVMAATADMELSMRP